ncbi:MAG: metal ABC transporter substrate-binding protein [Dehalococcoidia bacterium]
MAARALLSIVAAGFLVSACSGDDDAPEIGCEGGVYEVTVTLPMFAEFACGVGGEFVTVKALLPLDADPHSYAPPEADAELVSKAKLVLYAGLELDAPARDFILTHGRGSAQLIAYSKSITSPTAEQPPSDQPRIDAEKAGDNPYLWMDPQLALGYIDTTRDSLEIIDEEHFAEYRAATADYMERITELQNEITNELVAIPGENRKFVTLHNSMVHFARRFGFEVTGFLTEPGETASGQDIQGLAAAVQQAAVPAVFTERGYDAAQMQQVADAAGVELCSLYTDRLDTTAKTYIEMMEANLAEIVRCLGNG